MREQDYRRKQILAVAVGVAAALLSLLGGAIQSVWLAQLGALGFLAALATVIILGVLAWRRQRMNDERNRL